MAQGFKRYSTVEITKVYNQPSDIVRLAAEWSDYVKRGGIFCEGDTCPFVPGDRFNYDLTNFLYYRARAITADIENQNGDRFPHLELRQAYPTFVGKGVYFNHDSDRPEKAFGIILDAVYTPVLFNKDDFADKYVELLCAIDRRAINVLRPGLLGDIESGKVTSTSMGTIAQRAQCSICGNIATNMEQLCLHVHPQSPLYCKGRDVYGKKCYEDNYGLTFIEDSIVYIPADNTARMLEIYASAHDDAVNRMASLFEKYTLASGRPVKRNVIELTSSFKTTGGFMPQAAAPNPAPAPAPAPGAAPAQSPAQQAVNELPQSVAEGADKLFETKFRRMIEEELRKMFGPALEQTDKKYRDQIKDLVKQQFDSVKQELGVSAPAGPAAAAEDGKAPEAAPKAPEAGEEAPKAPPPAPAAPKEAAMQYPLSFVEDFSTWNHDDKQKLVQAIASGKPWEFKGVLEFPVKEA